ncbi:MAG: putative toxin-antitoxin system toxin component, PIN family [Terriglobales bacterium]
MHAVIDVCVWVSALLSSTPKASPRQLVQQIESGRVRPIVSSNLLTELEDTLGKGKFRKHLSLDDARELIASLKAYSRVAEDVENPPAITRDKKDDYLVALATAQGASLVSVDRDVLEAELEPLALTPLDLLRKLGSARPRKDTRRDTNRMLKIQKIKLELPATALPPVEPIDELLVPHRPPPQTLVRPIQYTPGPQPRRLSSFMKT